MKPHPRCDARAAYSASHFNRPQMTQIEQLIIDILSVSIRLIRVIRGLLNLIQISLIALRRILPAPEP
jgi:hypothetical protein